MTRAKSPDFSIFFFAADAENPIEEFPYKLLIEAAKFADANGFKAVWTPERHFGAFGGLYPNPSVTSAALAMVTEHVGLRAGSVIPAFHNPLRLAEEWSVVDNLSRGRAGVSLAAGWHHDDFVLAPDSYENRRELVTEKLAVIQKLWSGEKLRLPNGVGKEIEVGILPRPVQKELPVWLTCTAQDSMEFAGRSGFNALTNLNYKRISDLRNLASAYHTAHQEHHGSAGYFSLMCHGFIGNDDDHVWNVAGEALKDFLKLRIDMDAKLYDGLEVSEEDRAFIAQRAVEKFLGETSLIGTYDEVIERARVFHEAGADELACLIDFGVPFDEMMASLERVAKVKNELEARSA